MKVHDVIHMDVENKILFKTIIPLYLLPFLLLINLKWTFMPRILLCLWMSICEGLKVEISRSYSYGCWRSAVDQDCLVL